MAESEECNVEAQSIRGPMAGFDCKLRRQRQWCRVKSFRIGAPGSSLMIPFFFFLEGGCGKQGRYSISRIKANMCRTTKSERKKHRNYKINRFPSRRIPSGKTVGASSSWFLKVPKAGDVANQSSGSCLCGWRNNLERRGSFFLETY